MHIGIAGAGLTGRLAAWQLLAQGHRVTLFDRDTPGGQASAGWVAAAMLAPYSEMLNAEPLVFEIGLSAVEHWQRLQQQMQAECGHSFGVQQAGSLVVAHPQDQGDWLKFNQRLAAKVGDRLQRVQQLSATQLAELEPELAERFRQATWLVDEGCVDNPSFYRLVEQRILALGGEWQGICEVLDVAPGRVITTNGERRFDHVLDCRGFGAKPQLPALRGVRGEVLVVRAPEVQLSRPVRLMHPRYQLYIAPRPERVYVIGATEIESESMASVTIRSSLELMSALYSVHPGFAEAEVLHSLVNLRPGFPDNLPRLQHGPGLTRVNGLYRHGYLLGPQMVGMALALVNGAEPAGLPWPQLVSVLEG